MSMNRQHNKSPPCSTSNPTTQTNEINHEPSQTNENDNQWPRFLIMEATDKNIPLNLNVFTLKKAVDGMANGRPKQCKPMKSGSIFIEVEKKASKQKSLEDNNANGLYSSQSHPSSNTKFKEICNQMYRTGQHRRRRNKKRTRTTRNYCCQENINALQSICDDDQRARYSGKNQHWILEKRNKTLHSKPQRCFQCQKLGHTENWCKGKPVCAGCGEEGHNVDDCRNDPKFVNREGDHRAISKDCPIWKQEKDIVTLKYKENISFADARQRVQPISDPSQNSYASVMQTPPQSARPLQPWARNIRPPTDFQTEVQFLKYIFNYSLTRLDAFGNEQIPVHHTAATEDPVENTSTINTDDTTVLNTNTAASNDENNVDMQYVTASATAMKRSVDDDSLDEESRPNAKKMSAASSPASMRPDTAVSKEREGRDLPRISTFPSAPKSGEQRANGRSLSPIRPPSFTSGGPRGEVLTLIIKSPPTTTTTTTTKTQTQRKSCENSNSYKIINMAHNYIIPWNCRGLRSNREDIEWLISKYGPAAIFLQENMLKPEHTPTFKHYSAYYKSNIQVHGGVCILVKNNFIHSQVHFQADLKAVAVCITINNKTYTVASVYVPPSGTLNELAFDRIIKSFSSRYLVLGDFNGHSHLLGAHQENEHGKVVEKLIDSHNLILLNDSVHTGFDSYHQTSSLLDLSLCHPSIYRDVACEVLSDRLGSDHHPIIITASTSEYPVPERVPKWNFKKA